MVTVTNIAIPEPSKEPPSVVMPREFTAGGITWTLVPWDRLSLVQHVATIGNDDVEIDLVSGHGISGTFVELRTPFPHPDNADVRAWYRTLSKDAVMAAVEAVLTAGRPAWSRKRGAGCAPCSEYGSWRRERRDDRDRVV